MENAEKGHEMRFYDIRKTKTLPQNGVVREDDMLFRFVAK